MDYPFFMKKIGQCDQSLLSKFTNILKETADTVNPPHFDLANNPKVKKIESKETQNFISTIVRPKIDYLFSNSTMTWNEINSISANGIMKEHSDFESPAFDPWKCQRKYYSAMEVVLCHKIHIHLDGESEIFFRRSRTDVYTKFNPEIGGIYCFNNYVLHKSTNPNKFDNRYAMTLVLEDKDWIIKKNILKTLNLKYYQTFDGRETA